MDPSLSSSFPWLSLIVLLPLAGALGLVLLPSDWQRSYRWVAFGVLFTDLALMVWAFARHFDSQLGELQLVERVDWVPAMGLQWSLAADGISAPLVLLSGLVTLLTVAASWKIELKPRLYFALLLAQASAQGVVFLSQDFLLFFLAWELELVPVYLLIAIWGGQRRQYAATKFILYTATASLLILISGLALAFSGDGYTLNLQELSERSYSGSFGLLCYLGFLIGFGVKLPMFPLHTWLPDAHGEANAPVSMLLAGVLLKMGGYALLRFNVQMLPDAHLQLAPALMVLGIVNVVYGALNAFGQDNVKRRIACSSVSHMGPQQARGHGGRHAVHIRQGEASPPQGPFHQQGQRLHMATAGQLRHHPPPAGVLLHLGSHLTAQNNAGAHHRRRRLVTTCFEGQNRWHQAGGSGSILPTATAERPCPSCDDSSPFFFPAF